MRDGHKNARPFPSKTPAAEDNAMRSGIARPSVEPGQFKHETSPEDQTANTFLSPVTTVKPFQLQVPSTESSQAPNSRLRFKPDTNPQQVVRKPIVQRTIQNERQTLTRTNAFRILTTAFNNRYRRDPGEAEAAELQRLIDLYVNNNEVIRTATAVLSEVITNTSQHGNDDNPSPPSAQAPTPVRPRPSAIPAANRTVRPTRGSNAARSVERSGPAAGRRPSSSEERNRRPGGATSVSRGSSARREDPPANNRQNEPSSRLSQDLSAVPEMRTDDATHVGFEIEIGRRYLFPLSARGTLATVLNRTLCEYLIGDRVILEMLLDDFAVEGNHVKAQVEFRTTPLNFGEINVRMNSIISGAIANFPRDIISNPREVPFGRGGDRGDTQAKWQPTKLLNDQRQGLQDGISDVDAGFSAGRGALAQHATTSIEMEAFSKLHPRQQDLLYPAGAGARNKQQLLERIAHSASGNIDASTRGRNSAGSMVKTPVESVLAADPSLVVPAAAGDGTQVAISIAESHLLGEVNTVVDRIREQRRFPLVQGEGGSGYRAIAEKLQPPLEDERSGELRLLVEHRTGALQSAVNRALRGDHEALSAIAAAAAKMDEFRTLRERRPRETVTATTSDSPGQRIEPVLPSGGADGGGGGSPVIPVPGRALTLPELARHYGEGIDWANGGATFSDEFLQFRDQLDTVLNTLQAGGLDAGYVAYIRNNLPRIIADHGRDAAAAHPDADLQEAIFDELDGAHGRTLWSILRYLNSRG